MLNKSNFYTLVEQTVLHKKISYLDAIMLLCDEYKIDVIDVKNYITPAIITKLEAEARNLNMLKGGNTTMALPV